MHFMESLPPWPDRGGSFDNFTKTALARRTYTSRFSPKFQVLVLMISTSSWPKVCSDMLFKNVNCGVLLTQKCGCSFALCTVHNCFISSECFTSAVTIYLHEFNAGKIFTQKAGRPSVLVITKS